MRSLLEQDAVISMIGVSLYLEEVNVLPLSCLCIFTIGANSTADA